MTDVNGHLEVFVNPGEFYFGEGDIRVTTILGSCVSITLWHEQQRHGGLCHYVLESRGMTGSYLDGTYADEAMELFLAELQKRRTCPSDYRVKVFGGGNMLVGRTEGTGSGDIGLSNINAARRLLKRHGFSIEAESVGGYGHRRILFDLWNGDIWMRFQETKNSECKKL